MNLIDFFDDAASGESAYRRRARIRAAAKGERSAIDKLSIDWDAVRHETHPEYDSQLPVDPEAAAESAAQCARLREIALAMEVEDDRPWWRPRWLSRRRKV